MLTPRLKAVAGLVTGRTLSDIGTDHAYIPIELIRNARADWAIACDINPGPLASARANIQKYAVADRVQLRLGAGLCPLESGETDTVVIAGMGGKLIADILSADFDKAKSFAELVLQPMNAQAELRKYLASSGFEIVKEELCEEGFKVYNIISVRPGVPWEISEIQAHLPAAVYSHASFPALLAKKKREIGNILAGLRRAENPQNELTEYYDNLLKEIEKL